VCLSERSLFPQAVSKVLLQRDHERALIEEGLSAPATVLTSTYDELTKESDQCS
jgi:hypothetical protein